MIFINQTCCSFIKRYLKIMFTMMVFFLTCVYGCFWYAFPPILFHSWGMLDLLSSILFTFPNCVCICQNSGSNCTVLVFSQWCLSFVSSGFESKSSNLQLMGINSGKCIWDNNLQNLISLLKWISFIKVFEDKFLELCRLERRENSTMHFSPDIIFAIKLGIDDKWNMQHKRQSSC